MNVKGRQFSMQSPLYNIDLVPLHCVHCDELFSEHFQQFAFEQFILQIKVEFVEINKSPFKHELRHSPYLRYLSDEFRKQELQLLYNGPSQDEQVELQSEQTLIELEKVELGHSLTQFDCQINSFPKAFEH